MSPGLHRTVLIVGDYKESLAAVRSLGRAGCKLIVGQAASQEVTFAKHSRYTSEVWEHPEFHSEKQFIRVLLAFLRSRQDIEYVLPMGDTPVSCLARHYSELPEGRCFLMAPADAVIRCHDKIQMYDSAVRLGIPTAAYANVSYLDELQAAAERVGFPCVVKPRYSPKTFMADKKAFIFKSVADFRNFVLSLPEGYPVVVQKFVPGSRRTCYFIARWGHLVAYFEHQPLRTDQPDGTGIAVDSVSVAPTPELLSYTARFAEDLGYDGVGTSQFFFKEDGRETYFLEINPRFGATLALACQCGCDLPLMALQIADGSLAPAGVQQDYLTQKRIHCLLADILATLKHLLHHDASLRHKLACAVRVLKSWWNADCHMMFDWRDPIVTLRLWIHVGSDAFASCMAKARHPRRLPAK